MNKKEVIVINLFDDEGKSESVSENILKEKLNSFDFARVKLLDCEYNQFYDKSFKEVYTTYDNPFMIIDSFLGKTFYINPQFYEENLEMVNDLLSYIFENIKTKEFTIDSNIFINDKTINALCNNNSIEVLNLNRYSSEYGFVLTKEIYQKFKKSKIKRIYCSKVADDLKEVFETLLANNYNRPLIGSYCYDDFVTRKEIIINEELTEKELDNFKYLKGLNVKIKINKEYFDEKSILNILKKINEYDLDTHLLLKRYEGLEKEKFNKFLFNNRELFSKNCYITTYNSKISIDDYIINEKKLYEFVEEIKNSELSVFEKYLAVYNLVKRFKKYRENHDDLFKSRDLYEILFNEYIVCVGFSNLLVDLLCKVGINAYEKAIDVDISYDSVSENEHELSTETKLTERSGHSRVYVYINDPEYGIDGYYIADPTWDNVLENDFYNFALMTGEEVTNAKRYLWLDFVDELLNVKSIEEFYQKVNFVLKRGRNSNFEFTKVILGVIDIIKKLNHDFYLDLLNKYPYIENKKMLSDIPDDFNDLISEIGYFIVNKVNKYVSGETIIKAAVNVRCYKKDYTKEEESDLYNKLLITNQERQKIAFPKRYLINDSEERCVFNNENKFSSK